jgi:HD-GYP domain-containing protein (c-di-GMP phosphodiesterase class II)
MNDASPAIETGARPGGLPSTTEILRRVASLEHENSALGQDLLRCYEQLNLVYEMTEYVATLQDSATIQATLLRRYATLMRAGALWVHGTSGWYELDLPEREGAPVMLSEALLEDRLSASVASVRRTNRAIVPTAGANAPPLLDGANVLLSLLRTNEAPLVILVARAASDPPFDSSDLLAADSVLGYGGQILNNVFMARRLQQTAIETVRALARAIDAKDNYTSGHSERVGWLSRMVGAALELPSDELQMLGWAGLLHDVGKIGVPEHILNKPGQLTDAEFDEIKKHPQIGYDVLKPVTHFGPVLEAVLYHHENHDGSGYPRGLKGEEIPVSARIVHVVDIFDALTSSRSYRPGFPLDRAMGILRKDMGRVTDPAVTEAFIKAFEIYLREQPTDFAQRFPHIRLTDDAPAGSPDNAAAQGDVR